MKKFSILTTFPEKYYTLYGKKFIETFDTYWDKTIPLYVYFEGPKDHEVYQLQNERIFILDYDTECPKQVDFEKRNAKNKKIFIDSYFNIKEAAVRFSHKVYALTYHCKKNISHYVVWLDADTITIGDVDSTWLDKLTHKNCYISTLVRVNVPIEAGFILLDTTHPYHKEFIYRYEDIYNSDKIFGYKEWHDGYLLDLLIKAMHKEEKIKIFNLSPPNYGKHGHPFVEGILGEKLDHLKGKRKQLGYSVERRKNR